ncbi:MAG: SLC13 family permease [Rhodospirillales bacterium]
MELIPDTDFQMWVTFALIIGALYFYFSERATMELTSIATICALMLFFHVFPVVGPDGGNVVGPARLLHGFANPALITVLALMVVGQGMVRTGVLDHGARFLLRLARGKGGHHGAKALALTIVIFVSALLNNIPVVVIFIPIMQALAAKFGQSGSKWMMPLSFAAVFGGMITLIGSGTNLLVNSALIEVGERPFGFFDFTVPGLVLAAAGLAYIMIVAPRLLPERESGQQESGSGTEGKQYLAQITIDPDTPLVGARPFGGIFRELPSITVRMIQRGHAVFLPPFEDYEAAVGDVMVIAATRKALRDAAASDPDLLHPDLGDYSRPAYGAQPWEEGEQALAEIMIVPASRFVGQTLAEIGFRYKTNCIVFGIQRRSRMTRQPITGIRLQAGDVLLVQGRPEDINRLKSSRDIVLIEWSTEELPASSHARPAMLIFAGVVVTAASGFVPIVVSALCGAAAMVMFGVLSAHQCFRALDPKIVTTIAAALAMGVAMQATGGAQFIAHGIIELFRGGSPAVILSALFFLVSALTNVLSEKACAVLFTPIAVDIALELGMSSTPFVLAVLFAANCSFASPLGYQTNLLVMAPGNYRFADFMRVGLPLNVLVWIVFSLFVPWYYGI